MPLLLLEFVEWRVRGQSVVKCTEVQQRIKYLMAHGAKPRELSFDPTYVGCYSFLVIPE